MLASLELLFCLFEPGVRTMAQPVIFFISWYSLWFIHMLFFCTFVFYPAIYNCASVITWSLKAFVLAIESSIACKLAWNWPDNAVRDVLFIRFSWADYSSYFWSKLSLTGWLNCMLGSSLKYWSDLESWMSSWVHICFISFIIALEDWSYYRLLYVLSWVLICSLTLKFGSISCSGAALVWMIL